MISDEIFSHHLFPTILWLLALVRIAIEFSPLNLQELPVTKMLCGPHSYHFHRLGLILAMGYVILWGPEVLL